MKTYPAVITKVPRVGKSFIVGEASVDGEKMPVVAFNNLPNAEKQLVLGLQANQSIYLKGRIDPNSKMGKRFIIEQVQDAKEAQEDLKYSIDPNVDFIVGGLSSYNKKPIVVSEPREGRKQYYTDGDFYWYEGDTGKCPTSF